MLLCKYKMNNTVLHPCLEMQMINYESFKFHLNEQSYFGLSFLSDKQDKMIQDLLNSLNLSH